MGESLKLWTDGNGLPVGKLCKLRFDPIRPILGARLESCGLPETFLHDAPPQAVRDLVEGESVLLIHTVSLFGHEVKVGEIINVKMQQRKK